MKNFDHELRERIREKIDARARRLGTRVDFGDKHEAGTDFQIERLADLLVALLFAGEDE